MHRLRRLQLWVGLWAFVLATVVVVQGAQTTQAPPSQRPAPTDRIPVDPRITVRTLPNGLRTYVRVNKQPAGRAELRLVVNAGSVLEEDDQRGLAHFVEHMAFNGTRRFPRQDMAAFLQSIGMRFGSHVNAYTGYDETVYQLHVPTDDPRVFTRALDMIEDWAQASCLTRPRLNVNVAWCSKNGDWGWAPMHVSATRNGRCSSRAPRTPSVFPLVCPT